MKYINRYLENELKKRYKQARSVYLFGPRQSGKTTLAKKTFPNLAYSSLENPHELDFVRNDTLGYLDQFKKGVIIDEVQKYPELFSFLQSEIDIKQKKFILTGSQNFLLMEKISQSLAGRISILNLQSLSRAEKNNSSDRNFLQKIKKEFAVNENKKKRFQMQDIFLGGYPEVNVKKDIVSFWFSDYVQTYLERDLRQLVSVKDLSLFQRFLGLCAGRTGSILNYASLGSDTGISEVTCKSWISLLEQCNLIFLLKPYHKNYNKRLIKSPKLYFYDTGLLCFLLGIRKEAELNCHPFIGAIFETYIISEIKKSFLNQGENKTMYFWRDSHGIEIDLIIEEGLKTHAFEMKLGQTVRTDSLKNLLKWGDIADNQDLNLIYGGEKTFKRNNVNIISVDDI